MSNIAPRIARQAEIPDAALTIEDALSGQYKIEPVIIAETGQYGFFRIEDGLPYSAVFGTLVIPTPTEEDDTLAITYDHATGAIVFAEAVAADSDRLLPASRVAPDNKLLEFDSDGTSHLTAPSTVALNMGIRAGNAIIGGTIDDITVDVPGTGYHQATTTAALDDGDGHTDTATVVVTLGAIISVTPAHPTRQYTSAPDVTITDTDGSPGIDAAATAALLDDDSQAILFTSDMPDTDYEVVFGALSNNIAVLPWATSKEVTGFTVNVSSAITGQISYLAIPTTPA